MLAWDNNPEGGRLKNTVRMLPRLCQGQRSRLQRLGRETARDGDAVGRHSTPVEAAGKGHGQSECAGPVTRSRPWIRVAIWPSNMSGLFGRKRGDRDAGRGPSFSQSLSAERCETGLG